MKRFVPWSLPLALVFLAAPSCPGGSTTADDSGSPSGDFQWYQTCGDPVCNTYSGPFDGIDMCTSEAAADPCSEEGAQCDPQNDCNSLLVCASEDPATNCPISRARHKRDIDYLDDGERQAIADEVARMKLARWQYNWDDAGRKPHLGFIIDDQPSSAAVAADGEHVDLYGYTSMAVATIQLQQQQLEVLQKQVVELERRLDEMGSGHRHAEIQGR